MGYIKTIFTKSKGTCEWPTSIMLSHYYRRWHLSYSHLWKKCH